MALMRYEPLGLLNQLQREVNRLFETSRFGDEETGHTLADWMPAVDIKEEPNQFVIHADLPGVDLKDIEVTLENGVLTLKGQRARARGRKKPSNIAGSSGCAAPSCGGSRCRMWPTPKR